MSNQQSYFLANHRRLVHITQECFRIAFEFNPIDPDTQNLNFVFGFPPSPYKDRMFVLYRLPAAPVQNIKRDGCLEVTLKGKSVLSDVRVFFDSLALRPEKIRVS